MRGDRQGDLLQRPQLFNPLLLGLEKAGVLDSNGGLTSKEGSQPDIVLIKMPGTGDLGEAHGANNPLTILEGHAEEGGERLILPVWRSSIPMVIIVHHKWLTTLQHTTGDPFSRGQTGASVVPRVSTVDDQFQVTPRLVNEVNVSRLDIQQAATLFYNVTQEFVEPQLGGDRQRDPLQRLHFFDPPMLGLVQAGVFQRGGHLVGEGGD